MTSARKAVAAAEQESPIVGEDLAELWKRWCGGEEPVQELLLARAADLTPEQLVQLLIVEQQRRWQQGDRVRAEIFFEQYPRLTSQGDCAVDLVYAEFLLESDLDGAPDTGKYLERFPDLRKDLQRQFDVEQGLGGGGFRAEPETTRQGDCAVEEKTEAPVERQPKIDSLPCTFGDYDLLEVIAKGGMGIVYKARQRKLNRPVALKMIRSGRFADPEHIERFYTEARAAANLQHPNIVAVHEVGEYEGQHFFSMDYVQGVTLAEMVRQHALPPRRAAAYVKTVAQAMQYAHDHGVLHRDLKPANVLVDESDEPQITDFGLAKQVQDESHQTIEGLVMGTPSYMPPEQAGGRVQEVGPHSDVYSMGAVLYELLTGRPPFRAANAYETIEQVLEMEPVSPRVLNPAVPRDLETICLKCLQKEQNRRYATAQDLADELGRFLADEPIRARPVGRLERSWRWCHRNPYLAAAVGTAAICLLGVVVSLSWGYFATRAALATAERRLDQTRGAIDELFTLVADETLLNEPGLQPLRRELLIKARNLYRDVLAEEGDDPRIRHDLSVSHYRLGRIMEEIGSPADAIRPLNRARSMQELLIEEQPDDRVLKHDLANTWTALGTVYASLQLYDQARPWLQRSHDTRRELVEQDPRNSEYQRKLANILMNLGTTDGALGDIEAARSQMEAAQQLRNELLEKEPRSDAVRRDLAKGYYNLARITIALRERAFDDGDQWAFAEHHEHAMEYFDAAIDHFERLLALNPRALCDQCDLVTCYRRKAWEIKELAPEETEALYEKALRLMQSLAEDNPDVHQYQGRLASIHLVIGEFFSANDEEKALNAYQQAREKLTTLVDQYPNVPDYRADLAATLLQIGRVHYRNSRLDEASDVLAQSLKHFRQLLSKTTGEPVYEQLTAESLSLLAQVAQSYFDRGEKKKAMECVEWCLQLTPDDEQLRALSEQIQRDAGEE